MRIQVNDLSDRSVVTIYESDIAPRVGEKIGLTDEQGNDSIYVVDDVTHIVCPAYAGQMQQHMILAGVRRFEVGNG